MTVVALEGTTVARPEDGATSQGTTTTPLLKQRRLLQGSGGMGIGAGSTKIATTRSNDWQTWICA
jgi:hypothetical protein